MHFRMFGSGCWTVTLTTLSINGHGRRYISVTLCVVLLFTFFLPGCGYNPQPNPVQSSVSPAKQIQDKLSLDDIHNVNVVPAGSDDSSVEAVVHGDAKEAKWPIAFNQNQTPEKVAKAIIVKDALDNPLTAEVNGTGTDGMLVLPEDSLTSGMAYTLTLPNGVSFKEEQLTKVRTLTFVVNRPAINIADYNDNVVELSAKEDAAITGDTLIIKNPQSVKGGDVVIVPGKPEEAAIPQAYKVKSVSSTGQILLDSERPKLEEIFKQLEISGTWNMDPDVVDLDEEAIADAVRNSDFLNIMLSAAPMAPSKSDDAKISVKKLPNKDGFLRIEITITLKDMLKSRRGTYSDLTITLEIGYKATFDVNISKGLVFDVSCDSLSTLDLSLGVGKDRSFSDVVEEADGPNGKEYLDMIEKEIRDDGKSLLRIGSYPIPLTGPIWLTIGLDASVSRSIIGDMDLSSGIEIVNKSGIVLSPSLCKPYTTTKISGGVDRAVGTIQIEIEAGPEISAMFTICGDVAKIGLSTSGGGYAELAGAFDFEQSINEKTVVDAMYGYLEVGPYFKVNAEAEVNLLLKQIKFEVSVIDQKWPVINIGRRQQLRSLQAGSNTLSITSDGRGVLPSLTCVYYDVFENEEIKKKAKLSDIMASSIDGVSCEIGMDGSILFKGSYQDLRSITLSLIDEPKASLTLQVTHTKVLPAPKLIKADFSSADIDMKYNIEYLETGYPVADEAMKEYCERNKKQAQDMIGYYNPELDEGNHAYYIGKMEWEYRPERYLSVIETYDMDLRGAHGGCGFTVWNFDLAEGRKLAAEDVFIPESQKKLWALIDAQMELKDNYRVGIEDLSADMSTYDCFSLTKTTVKFYFSEYTIFGGAYDNEIVSVPFDQISTFLQPWVREMLSGPAS